MTLSVILCIKKHVRSSYLRGLKYLAEGWIRFAMNVFEE